MTLAGFETPFDRTLNPTNRWVVLSHLIPWDEICSLYLKQEKVASTGRRPLNPRIVIGAIIIKHICNLDDRETVEQISENIYMQYFLGYSSFSNEAPFDASLFVDFRKRLGIEQINAINERIVMLRAKLLSQQDTEAEDKTEQQTENKVLEVQNKGRVIIDATACPQDITYPTDLDILSDTRKKSEELIIVIFNKDLHKKKPRTYRKIARKRYLQVAQKKNKSGKIVRQGVGIQLRYLSRNLDSINKLLDICGTDFPLEPKEHKYLLVITQVYEQQKKMFDTHTHSIGHRIVSIHQPRVRPIVRGKSNAKVEFGSKINVSFIDGISFLDELSWEAFNEGGHLMDYVSFYLKRFGFYPEEVLVDKIYCTKENREALKLLGIKLIGKPLGRTSGVSIHLSPGERNPIEGKFG